MSRSIATLTATATAAAVAVAPLLCPAGPARATAYAIQQVGAHDLGPDGSWQRWQDDPANAGRPAGTQQVVPFADPAKFDGSLHLAVTGGAGARQARATHFFSRPVPLSGIASLVPSYDLYVRSRTSTPAAVAGGPSLQLPSVCRGVFTTLSFQPRSAADAQGRTGAVTDTWRHLVAGPASLWTTSRAVGAFAAGSGHPLSAYASACTADGDGATGVGVGVGRLGDPGASLDTYVDNIAVDGTVYEFTAGGPAARGRIVTASPAIPASPASPASPGPASAAPHTPAPAGTPSGASRGGADGANGAEGVLAGAVTFSSPAGGPLYTSAGVRLEFAAPGGLAPGDLTVTVDGRPVPLTAGSGGTVSAVVTPPALVDLGPEGAFRTPFTVAEHRSRRGALTLTAELLAQGYQPLQATGVQARAQLRH